MLFVVIAIAAPLVSILLLLPRQAKELAETAVRVSDLDESRFLVPVQQYE